jgi:hypothetical protein
MSREKINMRQSSTFFRRPALQRRRKKREWYGPRWLGSVEILALRGVKSEKQIPHPAQTAGFGMTYSNVRAIDKGYQQG